MRKKSTAIKNALTGKSPELVFFRCSKNMMRFYMKRTRHRRWRLPDVEYNSVKTNNHQGFVDLWDQDAGLRQAFRILEQRWNPDLVGAIFEFL